VLHSKRTMPEEVFETPQAVEPKTTNWPKIILAAIFGFALLVSAAYAGYWYGTESAKVKTQISKPSSVVSQPTSTPAATWSSYVNSGHSYSLKYRPDFVVEESSSQTIVRSPVAARGGGIPDEDWFDLVIRVVDSSGARTAREYVKTYAESLKFKDPNWDINDLSRKFYLTTEKNIIESFIDYKNGQIEGIKGDIDGFENPNVTVIQLRDNKIYVFWLRGGPNTGTPVTETAERLFEQVLSTFKLLD